MTAAPRQKSVRVLGDEASVRGRPRTAALRQKSVRVLGDEASVRERPRTEAQVSIHRPQAKLKLTRSYYDLVICKFSAILPALIKPTPLHSEIPVRAVLRYQCGQSPFRKSSLFRGQCVDLAASILGTRSRRYNRIPRRTSAYWQVQRSTQRLLD